MVLIGVLLCGGVHGLYRVAGDVSKPYRIKLQRKLKIKTNCLSWKLLQTISTFLLVAFAWIFFRSDTVTDAFRFIRRIITRPTPWLLFNGGIYNLGLDRVEMNILFVSVLVLLLVDLIRYLKRETLDAFLLEQNIWFEWLVVIAMIVAIFIFGKYGPTFDNQQFIYFQF